MIDLFGFRFCLNKVTPNTISSKVPNTVVWVSTMANEGCRGISALLPAVFTRAKSGVPFEKFAKSRYVAEIHKGCDLAHT